MVQSLLENSGYSIKRPKVAISACLLGEEVRYDGDHKKNEFLVQHLEPHVDWVPICPEVEMGMGIPREPIEIRQKDDGVRLVGRNSEKDWSATSLEKSEELCNLLKKERISGAIFKSKSPSCGLKQVPRFGEDGVELSSGAGLFSQYFRNTFPYLPIIQEDEVEADDLRQHWLMRVFAVHRLRLLLASPWTLEDFKAFHQREAFLLLAHNRHAAAHLEEIFVKIPATKRPEFAGTYVLGFLKIISKPPARRRIAEALRRLSACLSMTAEDELSDLELSISRFQRREIPISRPLQLISDIADKGRIESILSQSFLNPFPKDLLKTSNSPL